ncbi:hypothetical protein [Methanobrevibacter sp.]|uniref:hypothetical protein n=1 Tax=Methanobrevibacter sp. TaxID=66852 RepID=UPI0025FAE399|nr:hypothetical protein [Methanobrevibacter sp.]MBR4447889.1 hypothetical protein [Methanobrevibacter sp.]
MKFKKSLLIICLVICLFVMASVSASDVDNTAISEDNGNGEGNLIDQKINTTVTSQDVEISKDDPIEIPVAVKDNESQNIDIEARNITVAENNKSLNFNYNNSIINITDKLSVGNHSLIINYLGNDLYKNSNTSIILSIFGDMIIDAPSTVIFDGEFVEIPLVVSDGVRDYIVDASKLTLNLTHVDENGNTDSRLIDAFNIENNTVRFLLDDLKFVSANVNVSYADGPVSSKIVALKFATDITAENAIFCYDETVCIPITVANNGVILNIAANDLKVLENGNDIQFSFDNSVITITEKLEFGNHTLVIKYLGNDTFANATAKETLIITDGTTFWDLNKTINGNPDDTITLDKSYTFNSTVDSAFTDGIVVDRPVTINGNGVVIDAKGNAKIFTVESEKVTFKNITFKNAKSSSNFGGAIYFKEGGSLFDCTFLNNTAKFGGAVYFWGGNSIVHRCTFINNTAVDSFSAIQLSFGNGSVISCLFMDNIAGDGVVGTDSDSHGQIEITDNIFLNNIFIIDAITFAYNEDLTTDYNWFGNTAEDYDSGVPSSTSNVWLFLNATADPVCIPVSGSSSIVFKLYAYNKTNISAFSYDNSLLKPVNLTIAAINGTLDKEVALLGESIKFTATNTGIGRVTAALGVAGQSIELDIIKANSTLTIGDITFDYNANGSTTVVSTNALGVVAEVINHPNAIVTVENDTITVSGLNVGTYILRVTTITDSNHNNVTKNATITVNKLKTQLTAKEVKTTYKVNKNLVITLNDSQGKPLSGVKVSVNLKGTKTYTTDKNGQIKINVAKLVPKTYTAKVTFEGNSNYAKSSADVKVTVKKAKPKIIAKKKTYKAKAKTKKFKITLKDNKGKPIKKAKVRLIVKKIKKNAKKKTAKSKKNKKKNIAKTNKKGKATFKVQRNKKGKYLATVKFYGNKYYAKAIKKVKIKMK